MLRFTIFGSFTPTNRQLYPLNVGTAELCCQLATWTAIAVATWRSISCDKNKDLLILRKLNAVRDVTFSVCELSDVLFE